MLALHSLTDHVRCQHGAGYFPQGTVRRQGFGFIDVQRDFREVPAPERRNEGRLIDDGPPCRIDQNRSRFHFRNSLGVQKSSCFRIERRDNHHDVA